MMWKWVIARHFVRERTRMVSRVKNVGGCILDMTSCRTPNVVVDVDACEEECPDVAKSLEGNRRCDFVLMSGDESSLDVVFIEVTSSDYRRRLPDKIEQVVGSRDVFEGLRQSCEPGVFVNSYRGIVVSNIVPRSAAIRTRLIKVYAESRVRVRLARCGENIGSTLAATG